jgi:hypothetical protein
LAGVERHDKGFACGCVMYFGGDGGEGEQTEEAVAKVGSNGGSVGIEGKLEVFEGIVGRDANDGRNGWMRKTVNWGCLFVFCTFEERLLPSIRVALDGRSRGAAGGI